MSPTPGARSYQDYIALWLPELYENAYQLLFDVGSYPYLYGLGPGPSLDQPSPRRHPDELGKSVYSPVTRFAKDVVHLYSIQEKSYPKRGA